MAFFFEAIQVIIGGGIIIGMLAFFFWMDDDGEETRSLRRREREMEREREEAEKEEYREEMDLARHDLAWMENHVKDLRIAWKKGAVKHSFLVKHRDAMLDYTCSLLERQEWLRAHGWNHVGLEKQEVERLGKLLVDIRAMDE